MSQLLNINILEMQNSLITYNNFKELLAQFIFKNCKNIDTIKNDIPVHYDNNKNILYSFLCPDEENKETIKKPNYQISLLTISYSKYNNKFKKIDSDIVRKNIDNLFIVNNLTDYNTHVSYINIFKCCIAMVAFLRAKVLRTYFPLTNSYCYFYDGTSTSNDAPVNISSKFGLNADIAELFELLLTYMIGCIKIDNTYVKSNLFYSFLYNVNSRTIKPDELNSLSAISTNNVNNLDIDNSGYNLINKDFQITIS